MADEDSAPAPRRRGRAAGAGQRAASGTRRRRIAGSELVETLNEMVSQLIKENRKLKRQLARVTVGSPDATNGTAERTLRSLHRKVQRAVTSTPAPRRRRAASSTATPRRRTARQSSATAE